MAKNEAKKKRASDDLRQTQGKIDKVQLLFSAAYLAPPLRVRRMSADYNNDYLLVAPGRGEGDLRTASFDETTAAAV